MGQSFVGTRRRHNDVAANFYREIGVFLALIVGSFSLVMVPVPGAGFPGWVLYLLYLSLFEAPLKGLVAASVGSGLVLDGGLAVFVVLLAIVGGNAARLLNSKVKR